jgi:hypothetical protein
MRLVSFKITPTAKQLHALLAEVTSDLAQRSLGVWHPATAPHRPAGKPMR